MTKPLDLPGMKQRVEAASPGPWETVTDFLIQGPRKHPIVHAQDACQMANDSDLDFIAHARQDLPQLIEAYEALVERVKLLEELAEIAESHHPRIHDKDCVLCTAFAAVEAGRKER